MEQTPARPSPQGPGPMDGGGVKKMTAPGVEPGLSRPQRDVLTTRRCGLVPVNLSSTDNESRGLCSLVYMSILVLIQDGMGQCRYVRTGGFATGIRPATPRSMWMEAPRARWRCKLTHTGMADPRARGAPTPTLNSVGRRDGWCVATIG